MLTLSQQRCVPQEGGMRGEAQVGVHLDLKKASVCVLEWIRI